jgi:hypothetical protein
VRLTIPKFVALLGALFVLSFAAAFFLSKHESPVREATADASLPSSNPEEPPPRPFAETADRLTLGSGVEPSPAPGALAALDEKLRKVAALADGEEKLRLARELGAVRDRAAAPLLLDWATITNDRALLRAALDALGPMADAGLIAEIRRRFAAAFREDDKYRLAKIVRQISNREAADALIALAEDAEAPPQLSTAATEALATLGTPAAVSSLLGKLEAAAADDTARLMTALSRIDQTDALPSLQFAALGNKDASSERTRVAAILALANFHDEPTREILERLSGEPSAAIRDAARGVLEKSRGSR